MLEGTIDIKQNTVVEHAQGMVQKFYTPQALLRIVRESGFRHAQFEDIKPVALDSDHFKSEYQRLYNIDPGDLFIWENLLTTRNQ